MLDHWFWLLLTVAVMVWYSTVTVWVTIRGVSDIKIMLATLKALNDEDAALLAEGLRPNLPGTGD